MTIIKHAQVNTGGAFDVTYAYILSSSKFSANWRTIATYIVCKDGC